MAIWNSRGYRKLFRLGLGRRESPEAEMDQEIEAHLELRIADLIRGGMSPDDARLEAGRRFGGAQPELAKRELRRGARRRAASTGHRLRLASIVSALRLAFRRARRSPGFAAVTLATFAIGIGVTTATFTLVRSVILRPLPLQDAEQLVTLAGMDSLRQVIPVVSAGDWIDWRRESTTIAATALHMEARYTVRGDGPPRRVPTDRVSADFFTMLGTDFQVGRSFTAAEVAAGERVAVVSDRFWRQWLGSDPTLAGSTEIESSRYRIVGVVRSGQEFPAGTDVWIPIHFVPEHGAMRNNINWQGLARLKPGVTPQQAAAELSTIALRIRAAEPEALYSFGVGVEPLIDSVVGEVPKYLGLLMVAVVMVLLVACANLAALHLARGLAGSRETAVRAALGAGQGRLSQQIVVEHALTAGVGGLLGILLAHGAVGFVVWRWGAEIPRAQEVQLDWAVVLFGVAVSLVSGVLTSLAPAWQASRSTLTGLMAAGGRGHIRGGRGVPGASFLVAEIALALVLLTGAGLLIRSFRVLLGRELGFTTNVVTAGATLSGGSYLSDPRRMVAYWEELTTSLSAIPGVAAVGVANSVPFEPGGASFVDVENGASDCRDVGYRAVSEHYHRALEVPLIAGRWFGPTDLAAGERVVVINQAAAKSCWPGEVALGRRIRATSYEAYFNGGTAPWLTVVGITGDLRQWGPDFDPRPEMYVLVRQTPQFAVGMTAVVRGTGSPGRLSAAVLDRAQRVDPGVAIELGSLERDLASRLSQRRLVMSLLTGFGVFAVLLMAVGLYGLLSYSVSQRSRELALRAALGANRFNLLRTVTVSGLGIVALGAILGVVAAAGLTGLMRSLLVEVAPLDPVALGGALGTLFVVSLLAIVLPALRATRLDPATTLQAD